MSLLLDALKKAAEQKSQKSRAEPSLDSRSDDTLLNIPEDDVSRLAREEQQGMPADGSHDQTELETRLEMEQPESNAKIADATETQYEQTRAEIPAADDTSIEVADKTETQYEQTRAEIPAADDTSIEVADKTETQYEQTRAEIPAADDTSIEVADKTETQYEQTRAEIPAADDTSIEVADKTETQYEQTRAEIPAADDTSIEVADKTETQYEQTRAEIPAADDTSIEVADKTETQYEQTRAEIPAADDTSIEVPNKTETQYQQTKAELPVEDETDLSQPTVKAESSADELPLSSDDTDLSQPSSFADQIAAAQVLQQSGGTAEAEEASEIGAEAMADEDLSLLLIEPESNAPGLDTESSFTDPQDRRAVLADNARGFEELSLQEKTDIGNSRERGREGTAADEKTDTQTPTVTSPTATAIYADETRASQTAPTIARVDSTSTRTYAPDNYDRTLIRLPNDDQSRIFAGMKSDSDVVMTPDYAKKVFRSKTSAQRTQHYKLYTGIAVVIVLSVSIYGVFQYQGESEQIDDSLRALKRDPMPGVVKTSQPEKTELFAETEALANARTIEIIETANQTESVPEVAASVTQPAAVDEVAVPQQETTPAETGIIATAPTAKVEPEPAPTNQVDIDQLASLASSVPSTSSSDEMPEDSAQQVQRSNLQITASNDYRQADIWLREAYAAYRIGDNRLALARYNQVLEVDPGNRNALLARAAIKMQDGDIELAISDYRALLLANPTDSLAMSSLLAVADYSPQETESQLKLMLRDDPQSPYLNFALANAYGSQKRWQEAQRHYFTALQNNPDDPNYAYNLAVSLEHISQQSSAITYYQRALDNFTNGLATFNRDIVTQRLEILGQL